MAIPVPTVPSSVNVIGSVRLNLTTNNKAFYVNSGLIGADNTETTVISIADVGHRDILLCVNPILTGISGDNMTMKVKNNGSIIYEAVYDFRDGYLTTPMQSGAIHFIMPANTNFEITFTNADSSTHNVGASCYGYFMEGPH